ncbi:hypothetical protein [Bifidobacterium sp. ESL0790]|uniref:hypothetical protein n=1 Tax=Bifidobacterium sp. ESL0790 TaxID=2983233 RepID=UPI0023F7C061|nr:hypothetical protein [Bifidobacterium sp. ESL0790]WEV71762.1 hypothetical protein OZY47_04670 [Bifidobacterium sp. ESL0790]
MLEADLVDTDLVDVVLADVVLVDADLVETDFADVVLVLDVFEALAVEELLPAAFLPERAAFVLFAAEAFERDVPADFALDWRFLTSPVALRSVVSADSGFLRVDACFVPLWGGFWVARVLLLVSGEFFLVEVADVAFLDAPVLVEVVRFVLADASPLSFAAPLLPALVRFTLAVEVLLDEDALVVAFAVLPLRLLLMPIEEAFFLSCVVSPLTEESWLAVMEVLARRTSFVALLDFVSASPVADFGRSTRPPSSCSDPRNTNLAFAFQPITGRR